MLQEEQYLEETLAQAALGWQHGSASHHIFWRENIRDKVSATCVLKSRLSAGPVGVCALTKG